MRDTISLLCPPPICEAAAQQLSVLGGTIPRQLLVLQQRPHSIVRCLMHQGDCA